MTKADLDWAVEEATRKKKADFSKAEFLTYDEGLCVQCMHVGPYDDEPGTVASMHEYMDSQGYSLDITDRRLHHEIYLSDARRVAPEKLRTVIRHPIKEGLSRDAGGRDTEGSRGGRARAHRARPPHAGDGEGARGCAR